MCRNVKLEELDSARVGVQFYSLNGKKRKIWTLCKKENVFRCTA